MAVCMNCSPTFPMASKANRQRGYKAHANTLLSQGKLAEAQAYAHKRGLDAWFAGLNPACDNNRYVNSSAQPPLSQVIEPPSPTLPNTILAAAVTPGGAGVQ